MESVFIVHAYVDYEGSWPVRAFASYYDAQEFARECRKYQTTNPKWPGDSASEDEVQMWATADTAWRAAHPGGSDAGSCDGFGVSEVPFGAASQAGEKGGNQ